MSETYSRAQVADLLRVTPKTLSAWEKSGRIPVPRRDWRGWRVYDAATIDAIRAAQGGGGSSAAPVSIETDGMQISARNRLKGMVKSINGDGILCEVTLLLTGGQEVVAIITRSSAERLGLKPGVEAFALMKSTEVMIAR